MTTISTGRREAAATTSSNLTTGYFAQSSFTSTICSWKSRRQSISNRCWMNIGKCRQSWHNTKTRCHHKPTSKMRKKRKGMLKRRCLLVGAPVRRNQFYLQACGGRRMPEVLRTGKSCSTTTSLLAIPGTIRVPLEQLACSTTGPWSATR